MKFLDLLIKTIKNFFYTKATKYEKENLIHYYHLTDLNNDILNEKLKEKITKQMLSKNCTKKNLAYGNFLISRYEFKCKNYKEEIKYLEKAHKLFFETKNDEFKNKATYWLIELPKLPNKINISKTSY
jgi:hypothetical protein